MDQANKNLTKELKRKTRRCGPKVRTGCITCKIRRVKCDETQPSCDRCTSTGRKCDGYLPAQVQRRSRHNSSDIITLGSPIQDLVAAEALCYWSAVRLTLVFGQDEFWRKTLPHLALREPAVRYALIALRTLNERPESPFDNKEAVLALQAYNKSIQHLTGVDSQNNPGDIYVILVVCALFVCIELSRGQAKIGIQHIRNAIQILQQHGIPDDDLLYPSSLCEKKSKNHIMEIAIIFARLRFQSAVFDPSLFPYNIATIVLDGKIFAPPVAFTSVWDARQASFSLFFHCLVLIYGGQAVRFSGGITEEMETRQSVLCTHLAQWLIAFDTFAAQQSHTWDANEALLANTTKIQALGVWIWLSTCLAPNQCAFDVFIPQFETIVTLAEQITGSTVPIFRIDMGIICVLHLVGVKCRDARIRRRVLRILGKRRWREGVNCSRESYRIVHCEMTIEERNLDLLSDPEARPTEEDRIQASNLMGMVEREECTKSVRLDLFLLPSGLNGPFQVLNEYLDMEGLPPYLDLEPSHAIDAQ